MEDSIFAPKIDTLKTTVQSLKDLSLKQATEIITKLREQTYQAEKNTERKDRTILQLITENESLENHIEKLKSENLKLKSKNDVKNDIQRLQKQNEELSTNFAVMMKEKCVLIEKANTDKRLVTQHMKRQNDVLQFHIQILENKNQEQANELIRLKEIEMSTRSSQMKMSTETQTDEEDRLFSDDLPLINQLMISNTYVNYVPGVTDIWVSTLVERLVGVESSFRSNSANIEMMHATLGIYNCGNFVQTKEKMAQIYGNKVFYHGTDIRSATSILQNGIDVTKSFRSVDFSNGRGFYVTDNFNKAVEWSGRVARRKRTTGAVIAFRIAAHLLSGTTHLSLNVNTDTDRKWLECIVSHFRHGGTSPDVSNVLRDVKYIEGPVAKIKYLGSQELPNFYNFNQLCISDNDYARQFGSLDNILFVIFF